MMALPFVAAALLLAGGAPAAEPFVLHSSSFKDGERLADRHGGLPASGPNCFGRNVSPALAWSNVPDGIRSIAIVIHDPEGRRGLGVSHLVAYGIRPSASFAEGELSAPSPKFVGGRNMGGSSVYAGHCPPQGTADHHYTITAIATDLDPAALPPGLSREELFERLAGGHAKWAASLVGVARHPKG